MKLRAYLAGPIFSQAEIAWAREVKAEVESALGDRIEVLWPHEIASGMPQGTPQGTTTGTSKHATSPSMHAPGDIPRPTHWP